MYYVLSKGKYTVAALARAMEDWRLSCPAIEFLAASHNNRATAASSQGFRTLFERFAENGPACLSSSMLHEANKAEYIMELIKGDLRLLCFIEGGTMYLTNGYLKKAQKADRAEVAQAIRARKDFISRRK